MIPTPRLPLSPEDFSCIVEHPLYTDIRSPTADEIAKLHDSVRHDTPSDLEHKIERVAVNLKSSTAQVLYMAIDPSTGDSLLHTAVAAQRIDALLVLRRTFELRQSSGRYRDIEELLNSHKNHRGENTLHVAARTGNQEMVTAAYRITTRDRLPGEERYGKPPSEELAEYCELAMPDDIYGDYSLRVIRLLFLLSKNASGLTSSEEARAAGYSDIATWIDNVVQRSDPYGERDDPDKVAGWQEFWNFRFHLIQTWVGEGVNHGPVMLH